MQMKTRLIFLILSFYWLNGNCQSAKINLLPIGENPSLATTLEYLNKNYDVNFSYIKEQLPLENRLTIHDEYTSLTDALTHICGQVNLEYIIKNQLVIIRQVALPIQPVKIITDKPITDLYRNHQKNAIEITKKGLQLPYNKFTPLEKLEMFELLQPNDYSYYDSIPELEKPKLKQILEAIFPYDSIKPKRTIQIGLIYPLTSNWSGAPAFINKVSLVGLINLSGGSTALDASGIGNVTYGSIYGLQLGGLFNYTSDSIVGAQAAGLANITNSDLKGIQAAGLINSVKSGYKSAQLAGLANYTHNYFHGFQASGLITINRQALKGGTIAGLSNYTKHLEGIQLSSILNIALKNKGTQLTGFLNITDSLQGNQIALINFATKGAEGSNQIGLISYTHKGGYKNIEIGVNEVSQPYLSIKTGTERFYNIFKVGGQFTKGVTELITGYGVGTRAKIGKKYSIDFDFIGHLFFEGYFDSLVRETGLFTFQPTISKQDKKKSSLTFGPTFNIYYSENEAHFNTYPIASILEVEIEEGTAKFWMGASLGFRF
ncbi:hypothetical protein R9C00_00395 [Flammeovirgaceae bacterium SG7u.111]|nr:hypothetical protein [Flammeovirgaceae bacterium SG7u.132]WPO35913.1 hypothetical protein R9C00_00395 [Flammeovirgaceae bacterium SG7u.111]